MHFYTYKIKTMRTTKNGPSFINCNITNTVNKADSSAMKIVQLNQNYIYTLPHNIHSGAKRNITSLIPVVH